MKQEGIRQIVDREISKVRAYIPKTSSLAEIIENIGYAIKREGPDYQQRTWLYRADKILGKVDSLEKIAISENADPMAIKSVKSLLETAMSYAIEKEVANLYGKNEEDGVLKKFVKAIQKLDDLHTKLSIPADIRESLTTKASADDNSYVRAKETVQALERAVASPSTISYNGLGNDYIAPIQAQTPQKSWSLKSLLKNPFAKNKETGKRSWVRATAAAATGLLAGTYLLAQALPSDYTSRAENATRNLKSAAQGVADYVMHLRDRPTSALVYMFGDDRRSVAEIVKGQMKPFYVNGRLASQSRYSIARIN